ncbi:hypothetical protein G3N55_08050 [Dissulfurirhabdus thermomarina]|uniref:Uncharacterized protein n=1 Tax=Dissulfurirhabdus thermomarina TaxID=1765737 RepID=A0A6N9TRQ0_DISTH|nr:hypothetical protein [Dissulfurirhabdus thermomarina]NDY42793.1 hypothetical protein [Dissulfurirhabdus thermomarina]NMX23865.1 hypothetical protein [Dissulfurirhabdus thermomarina]
MTSSIFLSVVPGHPVLSILIWVVVGIVALYFARSYAHQAIRSVFRVVRNAMRVAARSVLIAERNVVERNREVLLAAGLENVERFVEREFHRVDAVVERDLQGYPALHRKLSEQIAKIDEDYRESTDAPPLPPTWVNAVEAVAKIPDPGNNMVASMLGDIHKTLVKQQKQALAEYREATKKRHALLNKMMPYWRRMSQTLEDVGKSISGLQERAKAIDARMQEYEEIQRGTDRAIRMLSSSAMTQFFISGFVLLIAIGGAVINFNLIALPMSEMVGGGSYIGGFRTADVAAMVIILVETAMGLYLMESLRITRLFPVIGSLDDKLRVRMIWISLSILVILAGVESSLAFMRDMIAADIHALRASLGSGEEVAASPSKIPMIGQMVMGFIFPFALTFVAIPLESFVHSGRTVMGSALAAFLRFVAFGLRFVGNVAYYTGAALVAIYDLLIFPPLWIENYVQSRGAEAAKSGGRPAARKAAKIAVEEVSTK